MICGTLVEILIEEREDDCEAQFVFCGFECTIGDSDTFTSLC
jgi:hypothetical protein